MFLVVGDDSGLIREQLVTEGLNGSFHATDVLGKGMDAYDLILVCKPEFTRADEAKRLNAWLDASKKVILISPLGALETFAGLSAAFSLDVGYLTDPGTKEFLQIFSHTGYPGIQGEYPVLDHQKQATGSHAILKKKMGKGWGYVICFDLCRTLFSLFQGEAPGYLFRDEKGRPRIDFGCRVQPDLKTVPQADQIRRLLITLIEKNLPHPLPRVWYFSDSALACMAVTHDSDGASDKDLKRVQAMDREKKITPTVFMMVSDGKPWSWKKTVADLQLHPVLYYRFPLGLNRLGAWLSLKKKYGFWQWLFYVQAGLFQRFSSRPLQGIRNHGLVMPPLPGHLDTLEKLGVSYDATFGSNYYCGYLYGTGKPYFLRYPGPHQPSDILEFPLHVMDSVFIQGFGREWGKKDPFESIRSLMDDARTRYHSLLTVNFHHYFLLHPDGQTNNRDLYEAIIDYAADQEIQLVNLTWFNRFNSPTESPGLRHNR